MNVLTARVDGYFYLSLTKQNMTCHYFDFFLQKSAVPETDITFSDKGYDSPQRVETHKVLFKGKFCQTLLRLQLLR